MKRINIILIGMCMMIGFSNLSASMDTLFMYSPSLKASPDSWPDCGKPNAFLINKKAYRQVVFKNGDPTLNYKITGYKNEEYTTKMIKVGQGISYEWSEEDLHILTVCDEDIESDSTDLVLNENICFQPNENEEPSILEFTTPKYHLLGGCIVVHFPINDFCNNPDDAYYLTVEYTDGTHLSSNYIHSNGAVLEYFVDVNKNINEVKAFYKSFEANTAEQLPLLETTIDFFEEQGYEYDACYSADVSDDICKLADFISVEEINGEIVFQASGINEADFAHMLEEGDVSSIYFQIDATDNHGNTFHESVPFYTDEFGDVNNWSFSIYSMAGEVSISLTISAFFEDATNFACDMPSNYTVGTGIDICPIFGLLRFNSLESGLLANFDQPDDPNYLLENLNLIGIESIAEADELVFDLIDSISLTLSYSNAITSFDQIIMNYEVNSASSLENFEVEFGVFSLDGFEGSLVLEFFLEGGKTGECFINPIYLDDELPLPEYNCGDAYSLPIIENQDEIPALFRGDIIYVAGLAVKITEIEFEDDYFRGEGYVSVPFGKRKIKVEFEDGILVNTDYEVFDGEIRGVVADPSYYPDFVADPGALIFGEEICVPPAPPAGYNAEGFDPVTGLNDRGFYPDGTHVSGGNYDENGFDINGIHEDTNSLFNEEGCSASGMDIDGNPCDPSQSNDPSVVAFIDSVTLLIPEATGEILDEFIQNVMDNLENLGCDQLRSELSTLIAQAGYNADYVVGSAQQYLNEGMNSNFTSRPQKMVLQSDQRLQIAIDVEDKHIELYDCDRQATIFASYLSTLDGLSIEEISADLIDRLQSLTKYQVDNFNENPVEFEEWIAFQISQILDQAGGFGHVDFPESIHNNPNDFQPAYSGYSGYNAVASSDDLPASLFESSSQMEEKMWMFEQGYQNIMGIDRAFYLEELYNQMTSAVDGSITVLEKLPMRLRKDEDGVNYDIYLDNMVLSPAGASIDAYFVFTVPESGKKVVFKLLNLDFGRGGIIGEAKLQLESEIEIRMNNVALLRILPGEETFVAWDCEGFTSMSLAGQVELCRNIIVPLDESTLEPLPDPERYAIDFNVSLAKWTNFYMTINEGNIQPFAIAGYEDLKWTVNHMALDFSDVESPTITNLPVGYSSIHYNNGEMEDSWRGFYLGELSVTIPSTFTQEEGNHNTIGVRDLVIDDNGVSAVAFFEGNDGSILPLDEGNAGGWGISIDQISLVVLNNHLNGGGFGGKIQVPVIDEPLEYSAMIYAGGNMEFTVSPTDTIGMDVMLGEALLFENSYIQMTVDEGDVTAKAHLNGVLEMNDTADAFPIKISDITFTGFEVSNKAPYFTPGDWEVAIDIGAKFGGFEINIDDIGLVHTGNDEEIGLGFTVDLLLEGNNKLNAIGAFEVIGQLDVDENGRQDWNYDRTAINSFHIDVTFSAGRVVGTLIKFEGDPVYGKGFQGMVEMEFQSFGNIQAVGIFGKTDHLHDEDYKFFMIDAQASISGAGIPAGPLTIEGFAGGVSYHMVQDFGGMAIAEDEIGNDLPPLGSSLSGVIYSPDPTIGLGLKAGALISVAGKKAVFNGKVTLEMIFNDAANNENGGGLHSISFEGIGQFMNLSPLSGSTSGQDQGSAPAGVSASLSAHLLLSYNHTNREFLGQFKVYLDTPGSLLYGAGINKKMVNAEIYFGPEQWYIYMGTPSDPCGIILDIPLLGSIEKTSYLMVGTEIPNMPDLPANVREIAFTAQPPQTFRQSGAGFVFGSAFNISAELNLGIASGQVSAGMGYDVMMRQYENAYCLGNHPYEELGINGWYAMGQMWAFIEGQVRVFGIKILEAGIAAVLQAQFPNPFFAQATLGFRVKIGPFEKSGSLDFAIGDYCIIVGNESSEIGMDIIANTNPTDNLEGVPVDSDIEVYFNLPLGQSISMPDPTSLEGEEVTYRVDKANQSDIEIMSSTFGEILDYDLEYKNNNSMLLIKMRRMYYAGDTISMTIELDISKNGSQIESETKTITFVVGESYELIPESNVDYSYPLDGMHNFYKEEYNQHQGFIQLKSGMPELFYEIPEGYDQRMRLTSEEGTVYVFDYEYNSLGNIIEFPMNPEILQNDKMYKLEVVRLATGSYDDYIESSDPESSTSTAWMMGVPLPSTGDIKPEEDLDNGVLYQMYFRTSEYNTLQEKLDDGLDGTNTSSNSTGMRKTLETEAFDLFETSGVDGQEALVSFYADHNNSWFQFYNNMIYDKEWPVEISFEIPCETDGENENGGFNGISIDCPHLIDFRDVQVELDINKGIFLSRTLNENHFVNSQSFLNGIEYTTSTDHGHILNVPDQLIIYNPKRIAGAHLLDIKYDIENCLLVDEDTWLLGCLPDFSQDYPVLVSGASIEPTEMKSYLNYGATTNSYDNGDYEATMEYILPNGLRTSIRVITFSFNGN